MGFTNTILYNLILVTLGFNIVIVARYVCYSTSIHRTFRHIPGPKPSSLIWGEEWELYNRLPGSLYVDWHKRFGKIISFYGAFGHRVISTTDRRAIEFILGDGIYSFPKPSGVRAWFKATLGEGILWVEGKKMHEQQRRSLAPALNQQSVRGLTNVFFETSTLLANQWSKLIEEGPEQETLIEITNWAGRFALDCIGRAAFSYDFGCLSGEAHELAEALDGLTNNEHKRSSFYMRALFWFFPSILFIGKKGEMIRQVKRELGMIASKIWKDTKLVGESESRTIMANLLQVDRLSNPRLEEEQILSQVRTVMSAGYETVSATVAWMLYEIASNPAFQTDLREEICAIPDPTFEHLNAGLPLLDAALKETLRLHPVILENHHEAAETVSIPLSEEVTGSKRIIVPKGTIVLIPINVLQTDIKTWGSDAGVFQPKRWLGKDNFGKFKGQELLAFSLGPRSCIGKTFATIEIKALIFVLLQQFSFRCTLEIEPFQSFVIRPRVKGDTASSLPLFVKKI